MERVPSDRSQRSRRLRSAISSEAGVGVSLCGQGFSVERPNPRSFAKLAVTVVASVMTTASLDRQFAWPARDRGTDPSRCEQAHQQTSSEQGCTAYPDKLMTNRSEESS